MKIIRTIADNFFLKKHIPLDSTITILKKLYPEVNWTRVDFYEGLPWFTPLVAPYVTAQALPDFYSFSRYRIYLRTFDESRAQCLADIVHEGYHITQAMAFLKGYGIGFLRGLMVYYNALYLKHGYRSNPFEVPAYDQEFRFLDYCKKHGFGGIIPKMEPEALSNIETESALVFRKPEFKYEGNYFALAGSFILCLTIALSKPLIDILVFLFSFWFRMNKAPADK
jgi:hypothetical protein